MKLKQDVGEKQINIKFVSKKLCTFLNPVVSKKLPDIIKTENREKCASMSVSWLEGTDIRPSIKFPVGKEP